MRETVHVYPFRVIERNERKELMSNRFDKYFSLTIFKTLYALGGYYESLVIWYRLFVFFRSIVDAKNEFFLEYTACTNTVKDFSRPPLTASK